jgi:hypothetical protein
MTGVAIFLAVLAVVGTLIAGVGGSALGAYISGKNQDRLARQQFAQLKEQDDIAHARELAAIRRERLIRRYERVLLAAEAYRTKVYFFSSRVARLRVPGINTRTPSGEHATSGGGEEPAYTAVLEAAQELENAYTLLTLEHDHRPEIKLCIEMERQCTDYLTVIGEGKTPTFPIGTFEATYNQLVMALQGRMRDLGETPSLSVQDTAQETDVVKESNLQENDAGGASD